MKPPRSSIRPRGVGPRPGTPKSVRTEGARLLAKLRAKLRAKGGSIVIGPSIQTCNVTWRYEQK